MKRKGYVTMIVLLICFVCFTAGYFVCEVVFMQSRLQSNRQDKIQAGLLLESEINKLVYEDSHFYKRIEETVITLKDSLGTKYQVPVSISGLTNEKGSLTFQRCEEGKLTYRLAIEGYNKEVLETIVTRGHVFNPAIDHCKNGLVTLNGMSLEDSMALEAFIMEVRDGFNRDLVPGSYRVYNNYLENQAEIQAHSFGYNSRINFIKDGLTSWEDSIPGGSLVLFKRYDRFCEDTVRIVEHSLSKGTGILKGVIFIEKGDLILSGDISFTGIIILGDGSLYRDGEGEISIQGKVVINSFIEPDPSINIKYHQQDFLLQAKKLPGLISPGLDSIR